jgi:hypothetical protein
MRLLDLIGPHLHWQGFMQTCKEINSMPFKFSSLAKTGWTQNLELILGGIV